MVAMSRRVALGHTRWQCTNSAWAGGALAGLSMTTGGGGGASSGGNPSSTRWVLPPSWREPLAGAVGTDSFAALRSFVESERACSHVLPAPEETFAALELCTFDSVRVVILGQVLPPSSPHALSLTPSPSHHLSHALPPQLPFRPSLHALLAGPVPDAGPRARPRLLRASRRRAAARLA